MASGKLYISGEYAVVDGGEAIIAAVDRELTCRVALGEDERIVRSLESVPACKQTDEDRYIKAASYIAQRYLREEGSGVPENVKLEIHSELIESDGRKYGLGSSGAVTVAVLQALLASCNLSDREFYKLAVLALLLVGDNGSFGDVACSVYGSLISYIRPTREFVTGLRRSVQDIQSNVHSLIQSDWRGLRIERLSWPHGLHICVGWTGSPASSTDLVHATGDYKINCPDDYVQFCSQISAISSRIAQACVCDNADDFLAAYADASRVMSAFSEASGGFAETTKLKELKTIAEKYGFVGKFSGAGGGDCGIAIGKAPSDTIQLRQEWNEAGIIAMNWKLLEKGAL